MRVQARAKINLYLHILGRRPDGYHEIDSGVVFADLADALSIAPAKDLSLRIDGEFADQCGSAADNLVMRAAQALNAHAGTRHGAHLTLTKNIPVGAGLGGGSADAAAALKGLNDFWKLGLDFDTLLTVGRAHGADVPMCLYGVPLRARGIGEQIETAPEDEGFPLWLVLIYPRVGVSTAQIFGAIDENDRRRFAMLNAKSREYDGSNDLLRVTMRVLPEMNRMIDAIIDHELRPLNVRMSGSGSCLFTIHEDEASANDFAQSFAAAYPQWWVRTTAIAR